MTANIWEELSGRGHPMSAATAPPTKPRRRPRLPLLIALLVLLIVTGVPTGLYLYHYVPAERELQEAIAAVEQTDPRWRLEHIDADRAAVPDADNGALHILAVVPRIPADFTADHRFGLLFSNVIPPHRLSDEQAKALRDEMARAGAALPDARKLKDFPRGRFPITYTRDFLGTVSKVQEARNFANLLYYDAMLRAHDGDIDGALASCLGVYNASRAIGDEPSLIAQLVRVALRALAVGQAEGVLGQGRASEASLKALQRALEDDEPAPLLLIGLRGERGGLDAMLEAVQAGDVDLHKMITNKAAPPVKAAMQRGPWVQRERARLLRHLTELVEAAKLPYGPRHARIDAVNLPVKNDGSLVAMFLPAAGKVSEAEQRSVAQLRCAIAALAAERYRLRRGRWPDGSQALVGAGYLAKWPADPYDGRPLRWRRTKDGVTVYALGADRMDNGGRIDRNTPGIAGSDQGFQLWDEDRRAQPPLPPPAEINDPPPGGEPAGPPEARKDD